jgi:hypothetical protein
MALSAHHTLKFDFLVAPGMRYSFLPALPTIWPGHDDICTDISIQITLRSNALRSNELKEWSYLR